MIEKKVVTFLIFICLALSSFFLGYLIVHKDLLGDANLQAGSILFKFESPKPETRRTPRPEPVSVLIEERILSFELDGNYVRYVSRNGQILELNTITLEQKVISNTIKNNVLGVLWANNSRSLVYLLSEGGGYKYLYFDSTNGQFKELTKSIESVSFSPIGEEVAYYIFENGAGAIITSKPGNPGKKLLSLRSDKIDLSWIKEDVIALKYSSGNTNIYDLYLLSLDGRITKILERKNGLSSLWNPNAKKLLYSEIVDEKNILNLLDIESNKISSMNTEAIADRCAWGSNKIICAVSRGGGDQLVSIGLDNMTEKSVAPLNPGFKIDKLALSDSENYVVILNSQNNKLYKVLLIN